MGTRNLTIVRVNKKTKVAQYGQWDGYPTGQGATIAEFLKTVDLGKFKKQVKELGVYTQKGIDKVYTKAGHDGGEWMSMEIGDKVKELNPEISRDYGAGILALIHNGKVKKVVLQEDFKEDSTWCEYYYEIDLDKETVSMNGGKEYPFIEWTEALMKKLEEKENND